MEKTKRRIFWIVIGFAFAGMLAEMAIAETAPRITKEELKPMLGQPGVIVIDVRTGADWDSGRTKIQGAIRENPQKSTKSWAEKYSKDQTLILYCS